MYHSSCKDFARDKHYTDLKPGTYKTLPTRWDRVSEAGTVCVRVCGMGDRYEKGGQGLVGIPTSRIPAGTGSVTYL